MQIQTDRSKKEVKTHGTYEFPVLVSHEKLSNFETRRFQWHWHTEIEWTYVTDGEILYQINDTEYHLLPGQGVFCNTNRMHTGGPLNEEDCKYISITFHPRLLSGYENSFLSKRYVSAITEKMAMSSFLLTPDIPWQNMILEKLKKIEALYFGQEEYYDFQIYMLLMESWFLVYEHRKDRMEASEEGKNMHRLKKILSYIQEHYAEKITLEQIAGEINICTGECCRFFKKHMRQSVFEYLLDYRIQMSLKYLSNDYSVTEAGEECGFSSPAYFSKVFRARMGCTPGEYRKNNTENLRNT